ncbi:hypothetical protein B0H13DRAFT_252381 [Mycena leptocephala]|nr:hypothetical protein B0H13DRAFT_252381 [Mycena leptocephala]
MYSFRWSPVVLVIFLGQLRRITSTAIPRADDYEEMGGVGKSRLNYLPRDTASAALTFTPSLSATLIETVSLSTTVTASLFTASNGEVEITSIPLTLTFATLVPYVPSGSAAASDLPSATAASETTIQTPKSSLPILPYAAGGGGLIAVILLVTLWLLCRRRRRVAALRRSTVVEKQRPNLDSELPRARGGPSRTFSRLTFSAPYVLPGSDGAASTAAPSTVSIGQQYRTAPSSRSTAPSRR